MKTEERTPQGTVRVSDLSEAAVIRRGAASLRQEIGHLSAALGRLMVGAGVAAALIEDDKPMYQIPDDVQVATVIEFFSQAAQAGLTADQTLMLLLDYLSGGLIRDDQALKHQAQMIAVMNERGRLHELKNRAETTRAVLHILRDGSHRWESYARGLAGGGGYGGYAEGAADAIEREVMELAEDGSGGL